jgi:Skp family chaperone for outer membrane proteins
MKLHNMGWIAAAALVAVAATTGFQGSQTKIGVVDLTRVYNDSTYAKGQYDELKALAQARQDMLQFLDRFRTFTAEDANKFHDLSMKTTMTAADKAELDKMKKAAQDSSKRLTELQQKTNPTPAEVTELNELSRRVQTTTDLGTRWSREAQDELESRRRDIEKAGLDKVRDAIKQSAMAEGYTLVFVTDVAPYGVNNLTDAAIKVVNKK